MSDWDELSPLEIDNARLRAELAAERERADEAERAVKLAHKLMLSYDKAALAYRDERDAKREKIAKLREALNMAVALLPEHRREYFDAVLKETKGDGDE